MVGQRGASEAAIARDLGIGANLLGRWCRNANVDAEVSVGREKVSSLEYERMRLELAKVKTEHDNLKKALGYFAADLKRSMGFIAKYRTIWPTRTMCLLLNVSSSGFYDWLDRLVSAHERENAQLLKAIEHSHETSDGTYGSPHVVRDLIDAGFACSENRVARLMKAAGIKARHKRRRAPGQTASPIHSIAPNLLDRQFKATGPNQKWAADFTYVWTG